MIRFGARHCCLCSGSVCGHIGGIQLCDRCAHIEAEQRFGRRPIIVYAFPEAIYPLDLDRAPLRERPERTS